MDEREQMRQAAGATAVYFDGEAAGWSERYRHNRHFRTRLETVLGWLKGLPPGTSALDYGCGSGVLLRELAMAGFRVTGADVSQGMLDAARRHVQDVGPVRLELANENFQGDFLNDTYNVVLSLGVLEYLDQPWALLEKLSAVLAPGGLLILSVPNQGSWLRKLEGFVFRHPALFRALGLFSHLTGPESYLHYQKHQFTVAGLAAFMNQRGLSLKQVRYHVAPGVLSAIETHPAVAMTVIVAFSRRSE